MPTAVTALGSSCQENSWGSQPASARGCSAGTALLQHPQKVTATQRQEGSALQAMGHTDHPRKELRHTASLIRSSVRHPHSPPQFSSHGLTWGFRPVSTAWLYLLSAVSIPPVLHLHRRSLPTTSTHTSACSFPQAVPTPAKPWVRTQLMRVPGSQLQGSSFLVRTLVASS